MMTNGPAPSSRISRSEWLLVLGVTLIMLALTAVPYLLAYTTAQPGLVFMDTLMNPEDSQTYFAKMLQGYDGRWLYTIPFSPEPHDAAFVGVFYVWLGQLARALEVSVTAVWHGSRVVAQVILCFVTFWFVAQFSRSQNHRWTAYLLALSGSGLGWLLFLLGQPYWLDAFPVDFKQPGSHLFFTLLTYPHIILATSLILLSVAFLARLAERPSWPLAVLTGFIHLALGIAYPFLLYLTALIAGLHYLALLWRERRILWLLGWQYAVAFLIPLPLYLYFAYTLRQNEIFRAWDVQAITPSAPWPHYLAAYAPFLLFGGLYAWKRRQERPSTLILWLWVLAAGLLLYAPLNPQRRFVQGVHVPLSILAAGGLVLVVLPWLMGTRPFRALLSHERYSVTGLSRFIIVLFLLMMGLSNLYLFTSVTTSAVIQQPDLLFRPEDELEAVAWLRAENDRTAPETAVVLGEYQTGNLVAARAGNQVLVGHWAETIDYDNKLAEAAQFYDEQTGDAWRQALLKKYGIQYVWHGPREQALGTFQPETAVYLRPVYQNETITIYTFSE
ncbi:MAG: hypothetical protein R6X34_03365 [Chloroflexota bacterium]